MKTPSLAKVTFYGVKNNSAKIHLICTKAKEAFQHEKRLLITVPTLEAAHYIDSLLWRVPEEGFMPHTVSDHPSVEWIVITLQETQNINKASRLLNLCSTPSALYQQVEDVYEIYDETHPQKAELSQQRLRLYQAKGLVVRSEGIAEK